MICSTVGCPFGEGCHFSHFVPGGAPPVSQNPAMAKTVRGRANSFMLSSGAGGAGAGVGSKVRLCRNFGTSEGCRFADKCHFAHGEHELRKAGGGLFQDRWGAGGVGGGGHFQERRSDFPSSYIGLDRTTLGYREPTPPGLAAVASFGLSSTARMSIEASLAGAIIGKGGVRVKQICRQSGAKVAIKDHESDPSKKNIEMEGSFDQIKAASAMVQELLLHREAVPPSSLQKPPAGPTNPQNYKTRSCKFFSRGACAFGDKCHFAHQVV